MMNETSDFSRPQMPSRQPPGMLASLLAMLVRLVTLVNALLFRPMDPTGIGLLRICCGLVVLYVHVTYIFDLQNACGKDAWLGLDFANTTRMRGPVILMTSDFTQATVEQLPSDPHEQLVVLDSVLKYRFDPRNLPKDDVLERARVLEYMQSFGVHPDMTYEQGSYSWSVWYHLTDPDWMMAIHLLFIGCIILFTIGFCSRVTSVATWMMAMCYIHRAPNMLFGQDTMMNIALVYLMIAPSGAAFSVDRLLRRWFLSRNGVEDSGPAPSILANFATRVFQLHFAIIYFASGTSKLQGATWWNGTALWGTLANPEFAPMKVRLYRDFLTFLCEHRWLWEVVCSSGGMFTILLELGFPFLIWFSVLGDLLLDVYRDDGPPSRLELALRSWISTFRGLLLVGVVLLHVGIAMSMGLVTFGLFMMVLVFPFIPPEAVRSLTEAVGRRLHAVLAWRGVARPMAVPVRRIGISPTACLSKPS